MSRRFTLSEAEELLPKVESALREALACKEEYQQAEAALETSSRRIFLLGGAQVDRGEVQRQKDRRESNAVRLKETIEALHEAGCVVKDLDIGLVDFPTLFRGQEVYLCWKLGETGIEFWHGVEEGFRGRKPIDREFLEHHQGESRH